MAICLGRATESIRFRGGDYFETSLLALVLHLCGQGHIALHCLTSHLRALLPLLQITSLLHRLQAVQLTEGLGLLNLLLPICSPVACSPAEHQQEQTVFFDSQEVLAVEGVFELCRPMSCAPMASTRS
jgi:hypothetical protein